MSIDGRGLPQGSRWERLGEVRWAQVGQWNGVILRAQGGSNWEGDTDVGARLSLISLINVPMGVD